MSVVYGLAAFGAAISVSAPSWAQSSDIIREVIVEGTQRIEPATVRSYLLIRKGDAYKPSRIDRSLKSLFATGLFADVSIRKQGSSLIVTVVENPVINRIAFEGNGDISDENLDKEVTLRPRVIYTRTKVQNDVKRLLTLYRRNGFFASIIDPKVIQLPQNRVDLVFEIVEGDKTEVQDIRFVGNKEFSDSRLREIIRTRETRWYRFFSSDDTYDPDRLTLDRELLRRFYLKNGYADFRVVSALAELTPDRMKFFITFTIEEGGRYKFGKVKVAARLRNLKSEQLKDVIKFKENDWYNSEKLQGAIENLSSAVGNLGYAFVDVRPRVNRNRKDKTISLTFEINEGPRVFVERIDIEGNVRTSDEVIRRQFKLVEGDAFNTAKLRRSKQRIQNLDFFEKVDVEQIPGSAPDKTVVKVNVEEKSTGSLSLGLGYSTSSGALADIGIREKNLLGHGQDLNLKLTVAARKSQVDLSFTEPYFMGREVSAGFDLFRIARDYQDTSSFDSKITGGALRMGYPITDDLYQNWKYTLKSSNIEGIDNSASPYIRNQEGASILSQVSHSLSYDRRDSRIKPTEGYVLNMTNDFAGLGGTNRYIRNRVSGAYYYSIADRWIVSIKGRGGQMTGIGRDIKVLDRFFIGGDGLRGFATSGVGPRDKNTKDALGGEWMYQGTAEMSFPLGLPESLGILGRVFSDMGSSGKLSPSGSDVEDTGSLRASVGAGLTWSSPLGPLGFDVGFPLLKEDFDITEAVRVNFGTRF